MGKWLPVAAALAVMAAAGAANGVWNDRWRISHELEDMTERLPRIPMNIGDWVGEDTTKPELTARLIRQGTLHALVTRTYRNKNTGEVVSVLLATGRPGPISTHNPLTCIGTGGGLRRGSKIERTPLKTGDESVVFSRCDFRTEGPIPDGITVFWSWHDQKKGWVAVNDARVAFASQRVLTKIYVTQPISGALFGPTSPGGGEAAVNFLSDCLPTIDRTLFSH